MKGKLSGMEWFGLITIILVSVAVISYFTGILPFQAKSEGEEKGDKIEQQTGSGIEDLTFNVGLRNGVNNTKITSGCGNTILTSGKEEIVATVTVDAYPDEVTTALPVGKGYVLSGDDDGTAPDYYYTLTEFDVTEGKNIDCAKGVCTLVPSGKVYLETETPSYEGYDANTLESTWNITVGTTKVTNVDLIIYSSAESCIGNPDIPGSVGICVNGSTSTLAKFNSIKPSTDMGTFTAPQFLTSGTSVMGCWWISDAICDGESVEKRIHIDPVSNPGITDVVSWYLVEKNNFENDDGEWTIGYEDETDWSTNTDIGITGSYKDMWFT